MAADTAFIYSFLFRRKDGFSAFILAYLLIRDKVKFRLTVCGNWPGIWGKRSVLTGKIRKACDSTVFSQENAKKMQTFFAISAIIKRVNPAEGLSGWNNAYEAEDKQ